MIIAGVIMLVCSVIVVCCSVTAPLGYEDEQGFHYGEEVND